MAGDGAIVDELKQQIAVEGLGDIVILKSAFERMMLGSSWLIRIA